MAVIEFIGIARSGKTTTARYIENNVPKVNYYPERHDLVPKEIFHDTFKHNLWYAEYCVSSLQKVLNKPGTHIFERGVIDRVIIGNAHYQMGWFSKNDLEKYLSVLKPSIDKVDKVYVFLTPVEVSVRRASEMGKDVTKAIPYMNALHNEYLDLKKWFPRAEYLPDNLSLLKLQHLVQQKMVLTS